MTCWLIEPRDPLIARDGRPANNLRFSSTRFPFPSMLAGAARTRMGSEGGAFAVARGDLPELTRIPVQGPILAELEPGEVKVKHWLAPAPRDASVAREEGEKGEERLVLRRLAPGRLRDGERLGFPEGIGLRPVFANGALDTKPLADTPSFWTWGTFESWLQAPADRELASPEALKSLGIRDLIREERVHIAIEPGERVGIEGMLLTTSGLRFLSEGETRLAPRRFAMSLRTPGGTVAGRALALREETAPLGGERRLARWSPADCDWPGLPETVRDEIVKTGRARLLLLTPACFSKGALPGWDGSLWPGLPGVRVYVQAACVGRSEVVSGWDLAAGTPKATRRLAGPGSVYFLKIEGSPEDVRRWCESTWLSPVNDPEPNSTQGGGSRPQPDLDGFGLAALGIWRDE